METFNGKNIIEIISKGGISAMLIIIILYFGGNFLDRLAEMQRDIAEIRLEICKMQSKLLSQQQVEKMIAEKIQLHEYHFHNKEK